MTDPDPLDRLSRVANQAEQPTPEFSARLLDELLSELTANQAGPTSSSFDHATNETITEVIMLSPDRNESRSRSLVWMAVAASVAAIALIGGFIVAGNRDSDTVIADEPTMTVPDTTDPNADTGPASTTTGPIAVETVTFTGEFTGSYSVSYIDGGNGSVSGAETWTGQIEGTSEVAGNIENSTVLSATGNGIHTLTVDIEGVGSGTLQIRVPWSRVELDVIGEGTVIGGTGDFADAAGTVDIEYVATLSGSTYGGDSYSSDGSYTIALTLPADRF